MWGVILGRVIERKLSGSKGRLSDHFSTSVKKWWKMAISHLKYSHLDWRAILCKKRMTCVYAIFSSFSQHFFLTLLIFIWTQLEFFKCMTWQSIFLFAFFRSHGLSTSSNDACHRWLSKLKHHFSCEDCFGFWLFGPKVFIPILLTKRGSWLKSISEKWAILVNVPQGFNRGDLRISWS